MHKTVEEQYKIDLDFLIKESMELIKSCKEDGIPLGGFGGGANIIKDRANWNKALQNLAKWTGYDVKKVDITSNGEKIQINLNLSDDEDNE